MGKREILWTAVLLLTATCVLVAEDQSLVLGREDAWADLATTSNVITLPGREGFDDIALGFNEYRPESATDLLLHFNSAPPVDAAGHWRTVNSDIRTTTNVPRLGAGSAVFEDGGSGILLEGDSTSLFAPGQVIGDFSIEFWLYPVSSSNGDVILSWHGSRWAGDSLIPQDFRIELQDRRVAWTFVNVFAPPDQGRYTVTLRGRTGLVPRSWHHHLLRFDATTGLLEYLVDGVPEAVAYTTSTGRESGAVFAPEIGDGSPRTIAVGPSYTGMLDELRFSRSFVSDPALETVGDFRGVAETRVFDMKYAQTAIRGIDARFDTPGDTAVLFFYRIGDRRSATDVLGADWTQFIPGQKLSGSTKGRYFQLRIELLPDGVRKTAPRVSQVIVRYTPDEPPLPPARVTVEPGNGSVTLRWTQVPEPDVRGYLVYYGEKPGSYFGTDVVQGYSPVDVGNVTSVTLTGLVNGKLYYFAVSAYDESGGQHASALSREVSARPLRVY